MRRMLLLLCFMAIIGMSLLYIRNTKMLTPDIAIPPVSSPTPEQAYKIVFLGDSLTEGYQLPKESAFPSIIEQRLKDQGYKNFEIINAGVSGSTSASGPGRLKWHLKGQNKPDLLVLALGANDGLRGLDLNATRQSLRDVITSAQAGGIQVLLCGMKVPPNYGFDYAAKFSQMFPELAKETKVPLVPFLLADVAGEPELNLGDGIHPNAKGYEIVATTVLKELKPLLPERLH